jgi:outer membrane protein OmpA-like peptidoglycan-associated protein
VPILEEAARTLKDESQLTVSVNGYTDSVGTDSTTSASRIGAPTPSRSISRRSACPAAA